MHYIKKFLAPPLFHQYQENKDQKDWKAGFSRAWTVKPATRDVKESQNVSIFRLSKKNAKHLKEEQLVILKKQPASLMRYKHPSILSLIQPFKEDDSEMGFVTQRAHSSLELAIEGGNTITSEMEVKILAIDLLEALDFLHNTVKTPHHAFSPGNIYLTNNGKCKLAGFMFSNNANNPIDFHGTSHPDLTFCAPQVVQEGQSSPAADIWSFGLVIIALLQSLKKKKLSFMPVSTIQYSKQLHGFIDGLVKQAGGDLKAMLQGCLIAAEKRLTVNELKRCHYLNDNFMHTYKYLKNITQLQRKQQITFVRGLPDILLQFQTPVLHKIVIPAILELIKFDHLSGPVVMNIIKLLQASCIPQKYFLQHVWPLLRPISSKKELSAMLLVQLVSAVELFGKMVSVQEMQLTIIPLMLKCIECKEPQLQMLALTKVSYLIDKHDYLLIRNKFLPRVLAISAGESNLDVRKYGYIALLKLKKVLDVTTIVDQILPMLEKSRSRGSDPFITAIIFKLYTQLTTTLPIESVGHKVLPSLMPCLTDMSLNRNEFIEVKDLINSLIKRVQIQRNKTFTQIPKVHHVFEFRQEEPMGGGVGKEPMIGSKEFQMAMGYGMGGGSSEKQSGGLNIINSFGTAGFKSAPEQLQKSKQEFEWQIRDPTPTQSPPVLQWHLQPPPPKKDKWQVQWPTTTPTTTPSPPPPPSSPPQWIGPNSNNNPNSPTKKNIDLL